MYKVIFAVLIAVALIVGVYAVGGWSWDLALLEQWVALHPVLGALMYIGMFIASTLLPVTSLPLLPLAARAYGVPMTCVLSTLGWWIGCVIAFEIGRWGRPFLQRIASPKMLRRCETFIARKNSFWTVVLLRALFPGDVVGLGLGLLRYVGFWTFFLASFIGTLPSSIVASYAGGEIGRGRWDTAIAACVAMIAAVYIVRRVWEARTSTSQSR